MKRPGALLEFAILAVSLQHFTQSIQLGIESEALAAVAVWCCVLTLWITDDAVA